jgi:hypothetical protein
MRALFCLADWSAEWAAGVERVTVVGLSARGLAVAWVAGNSLAQPNAKVETNPRIKKLRILMIGRSLNIVSKEQRR